MGGFKMQTAPGAPKSKIQFNGVGGLRTYVSLLPVPVNYRGSPMSNSSVKVAIALFMVLAPPAASFARGGHVGSAAMGGLFPRPAGSAGIGKVPHILTPGAPISRQPNTTHRSSSVESSP